MYCKCDIYPFVCGVNFLQSIRRRKTDFGESNSGLKRVLTLRDLVFLGMAAIIGGGIFSSVGEACVNGGPAIIYLFIICAIACGFAALCYAEFSTRIPVSGSAYTYAYASFGELFAWIIGWALLMEYAIGNIYVSFSWSGYFVNLLENMHLHVPEWLTLSYVTAKKSIGTDAHALAAWNNAPMIGGLRMILDLPALLINIFITALVYIGISESKRVSNIMVMLKVAVIIMVIIVGFFYIDFDNYTPFMPTGFGGVMGSVSAVFFTYIGFDALSTMAEECENPKRDLPRGMLYSLLICTVLYILISLVLTGMVNYTKLGVTDPLAFALAEKGLIWMEYIVSVSAVIAMTSVLLVFQMGQPRIWFSMSRDGLLPKKFSNIHPKFKTPSFATIVTGFVVGVPILFTDKDFVLDFTSIGTLFAFVLVCGGVLLLPRRDREKGRFHMPSINSQIVFPVLVVLAIIISHLLIPEYFSDMIKPENFSSVFGISHILFWIIMIILSVFAYLKKWSLIPLLGVSTCLYLLTGMELSNWFWFFIWFLIGIAIYFAYGHKKSALNIPK